MPARTGRRRLTSASIDGNRQQPVDFASPDRCCSGVRLFALCYWLVSLAGGEQSYAEAAKLFASPRGSSGLFGWTSLFCTTL